MLHRECSFDYITYVKDDGSKFNEKGVKMCKEKGVEMVTCIECGVQLPKEDAFEEGDTFVGIEYYCDRCAKYAIPYDRKE